MSYHTSTMFLASMGIKFYPFFQRIQYATLYLHPKICSRRNLTTMPSFGRKPKSDQGDKCSQDSHLTFDDKEKPVSPSRSKQEVQTGQVRPRPMRFAPSSEWNERQKLLDHSRRSLSGRTSSWSTSAATVTTTADDCLMGKTTVIIVLRMDFCKGTIPLRKIL